MDHLVTGSGGSPDYKPRLRKPLFWKFILDSNLKNKRSTPSFHPTNVIDQLHTVAEMPVSKKAKVVHCIKYICFTRLIPCRRFSVSTAKAIRREPAHQSKPTDFPSNLQSQPLSYVSEILAPRGSETKRQVLLWRTQLILAMADI